MHLTFPQNAVPYKEPSPYICEKISQTKSLHTSSCLANKKINKTSLAFAFTFLIIKIYFQTKVFEFWVGFLFFFNLFHFVMIIFDNAA